MRLTLSEPLNILWQMCSLQSGTDDIEENDADNAFHNKARNLSRTGIDAAVKNGAADEIADNHDNDTDNAGSGCTNLEHVDSEACSVGNITDDKAHNAFDDQCWDDPLCVTGQ